MSEHIVKSYEEQLQNLTNTIVKVGGLAESQFASSVNALLKRDRGLKILPVSVRVRPRAQMERNNAPLRRVFTYTLSKYLNRVN